MNADGMLRLFTAEPTLLPLAPDDAGGMEIDHRVQNEAHACAYCGDLAQTAIVAQVPGGESEDGPPVKRWLDLCMPHFNEVRRVAGNTEGAVREAMREAMERFAQNMRGVTASMQDQIAEVRREIDRLVIADHPDLRDLDDDDDPPA